jgi:type II secretory pathway pseudopilin PulG
MANGKKDMRSRVVRWIALGLVVMMVLGVVIAALVSSALAEEANRTDLQLTVLEGLGAVSVTQTTQYRNDTGQAVDQLIFQLAGNALRRQTTSPFESETMIDAYPDGFTAGGVELHSVKFNGTNADWGVQGSDEAALRVACSLAPGESGAFQFDYEVLLPDALGALGIGSIGWRLSGFYPLPAVWSDGDYAVERVSPVGDSLMADPADYHATVNLPNTWQVAAGGAVKTEPSGDSRENATVDVTDARFFGLALSRRYSEADVKSASGVAVRSLADDQAAAARAAAAAAKAVDVYSDLFGAYPRDTLTVAQADLMDTLSQAGLVLLPEDLYDYASQGELEYQVALGTARQWFGEMVGSNPAESPWLTESLSSYAALLYYDQSYGRDRYLKELNDRVTPSLKVTIPGGVTVDSQALAFGTLADFKAVTRDRGAAVLHELRQALGDEALMGALKLYVSRETGKMATRADFSSALSEAAGRDADGLLTELLTGIDEYVGQDIEWYN